ncbi:unnamed protein product [Ostreobium quekettii]|uniref:SAND domain-containing protein n=1 Tax=Ostreobium quekettii TaxID=121088 RepID=A0A8S1JDR2_9CHLO|nr:unnamed protein product [Ostreobium quekettii]
MLEALGGDRRDDPMDEAPGGERGGEWFSADRVAAGRRDVGGGDDKDDRSSTTSDGSGGGWESRGWDGEAEGRTGWEDFSEVSNSWEENDTGSTGKEALGCRAAVWWKGDSRYYLGRLDDYNREQGHHIRYDDGDHEWVDLDNERVRWGCKLPEVAKVVCNGMVGDYVVGKNVIRLKDGRRVSPSQFERVSGRAQSRKWKDSIRMEEEGSVGKSLGAWLAGYGKEAPKPPKACQATQLGHQGPPRKKNVKKRKKARRRTSSPLREVQRGAAKKRRPPCALPDAATALLKEWLIAHAMNPYPDDDDRWALHCATCLEWPPIDGWLRRARSTVWKPLLRAAFERHAGSRAQGGEGTEGPKKLKNGREMMAEFENLQNGGELMLEIENLKNGGLESLEKGGEAGESLRQSGESSSSEGRASTREMAAALSRVPGAQEELAEAMREEMGRKSGLGAVATNLALKRWMAARLFPKEEAVVPCKSGGVEIPNTGRWYDRPVAREWRPFLERVFQKPSQAKREN